MKFIFAAAMIGLVGSMVFRATDEDNKVHVSGAVHDALGHEEGGMSQAARDAAERINARNL